MAEEKQPEFQVTDRRRVTEAGELRPDAKEPEKPAAAPPPPPPPAQPQPQQPAQATPEAGVFHQAANRYAAAGTGYEKFTFEKIVISFAQTALLQLGLLAPDPSHPPEVDLAGARETIDMLVVLQEKTRGNLAAEEAKLLDNSLYELRMAWVEMNRRAAGRR